MPIVVFFLVSENKYCKWKAVFYFCLHLNFSDCSEAKYFYTFINYSSSGVLFLYLFFYCIIYSCFLTDMYVTLYRMRSLTLSTTYLHLFAIYLSIAKSSALFLCGCLHLNVFFWFAFLKMISLLHLILIYWIHKMSI